MERNRDERVYASCVCPSCGLVYKQWLLQVTVVKYLDRVVNRVVTLCPYCWVDWRERKRRDSRF